MKDYNSPQKIIICYPKPEFERSDKQIKPKEFLQWAKQDIKGGCERSFGNALGNIKKALHSRIDEIINSTHIIYAKDWNWKISTDEKIKILKKLGISYRVIVRIITLIRNVFEHQYILPKNDEIRANYETAELWMDNSYQQYSSNRLGIVDIPVCDVSHDTNNLINKVVIPDHSSDYSDIIYFWDYKKSIEFSNKDGSTEIKKLKEMTWKEILDLEKTYIIKQRKLNNYYLPQQKMTKVFHFYNSIKPRNQLLYIGKTLNL